eukprot:5898319-Amphidinium_carterae.1
MDDWQWHPIENQKASKGFSKTRNPRMVKNPRTGLKTRKTRAVGFEIFFAGFLPKSCQQATRATGQNRDHHVNSLRFSVSVSVQR